MNSQAQMMDDRQQAEIDLIRERARLLKLRNDEFEKQGVRFTEAQLAAAFTEWDRRYREEPERFQSEADHLLRETPETYGEACAPYLLQILSELRGAQPCTAGVDVLRDEERIETRHVTIVTRTQVAGGGWSSRTHCEVESPRSSARRDEPSH